MTKKKKLKKTYLKILLIFMIVAILSISITLASYSFYKVRGKITIPYKFKVSYRVGVDLGTDILRLGTITPDMIGVNTKEITITNEFDYHTRVDIKIKGNRSDLISPSENLFIMNPGESRSLNFVLHPDPNLTHGTYTGNVFIAFKKP